MRSGEIFSNREGGGSGGFFREPDRAGALERWDEAGVGVRARASPLRPDGRLDFLLEEGFERVIGMAKLLYCFLPNDETRSTVLRSTRTARVLKSGFGVMAVGEADRHYPDFFLRPPQAGSHTRENLSE